VIQLVVYSADREDQKFGFTVSEEDMFLNGSQPCLPTESKVESTTMETATHSLKEVVHLCTA
jgi:hypothetical protein